eukprot:Sspe_Gene.68685::Locus_40497_Transcript_1_1_Confidence_1.000_Length_625::g.68685::m.68685
MSNAHTVTIVGVSPERCKEIEEAARRADGQLEGVKEVGKDVVRVVCSGEAAAVEVMKQFHGKYPVFRDSTRPAGPPFHVIVAGEGAKDVVEKAGLSVAREEGGTCTVVAPTAETGDSLINAALAGGMYGGWYTVPSAGDSEAAKQQQAYQYYYQQYQQMGYSMDPSTASALYQTYGLPYPASGQQQQQPQQQQ